MQSYHPYRAQFCATPAGPCLETSGPKAADVALMLGALVLVGATAYAITRPRRPSRRLKGR